MTAGGPDLRGALPASERVRPAALMARVARGSWTAAGTSSTVAAGAASRSEERDGVDSRPSAHVERVP